MHKYDPAEARRLLTKAGHNRLEVTINFPGKAQGDAYITNLELVQAQFRKVGIDVVLKSVDQADFSNERKNRILENRDIKAIAQSLHSPTG